MVELYPADADRPEIRPGVFVTGAGGLLGRALQRIGVPGLSRRELDVCDPDAMDQFLRRAKPELVLFCAAQTRVDQCSEDSASWRVNVEAPAMWARELPVIFLSSNYVFSGEGPHTPEEAPSPLSSYGRQKAIAEEEVLKCGGTVVRTGWLFGPGGRNFPSRIGEALRAGPVRATRDWPVQPTWAEDLARFLLTSLSPGIHHAIGSAETTWYDFACSAAQLSGLPERVQPVSLAELSLGPRPADARLSPASLPGWEERLPLLLSPRSAGGGS